MANVIAVGDNAVIYVSSDYKSVEKVYKKSQYTEYHDEYLKEVEDAIFINKQISGNLLAKDLYLTMIDHNDSNETIIYPRYISSFEELLNNLFDNSKLQLVKRIMQRTLMSYIILYQKTLKIHGNLTYRHILLNIDDDPVIGGWGSMEKGNCKAHYKEFIWFVLQLRDYKFGVIELIQPKLIADLIPKSYTEITNDINNMSDEDIKTIFDHWIV